ncbi:MAG TPA: S1/P1 nuclease, partial [Bryobacteraceae bacterium]|nr:S1/P1 nuclease [Bryobacteraceae bacterium]
TIMRPVLLCISVTLISCSSALGWGCEGHQIVALIARAHLSPAAAAAVDQLLKENPVDPSVTRFCKDRPADPMADVATWADDIKNAEKTGAWHYIDIPLTVTGPGSLTAWCPPIGPSVNGKDRPGCVTDAIGYEWGILRDTERPAAERASALRYIIHFVGDIHQPLHDSDNDDRGGNCTAIRFFSEERPANLHAIWDYKLIQRDLTADKTDQATYAAALDKQFTLHWRTWGQQKSDPAAWAWEGNALAKSVTYGDLKPAIPVETPSPQADCNTERDKVAALHITVGDAYFNETLPIVNEQLAKAGYRLAGLLNATFL